MQAWLREPPPLVTIPLASGSIGVHPEDIDGQTTISPGCTLKTSVSPTTRRALPSVVPAGLPQLPKEMAPVSGRGGAYSPATTLETMASWTDNWCLFISSAVNGLLEIIGGRVRYSFCAVQVLRRSSTRSLTSYESG